jgi:uncharacterized protein YbaP (TraB family)
MKKILALLLATLFCLSMVACGDSEDSTSNQSVVSEESTTSDDSTASEESTVSKEDVSDDTSKEESSTPLLYKVTDSNGNYAWLFGSIHMGDDRFYPLPDYVMNAFNEADALAVEFNIVAFQENMGAMMNALKSMVYTDGTTIKDHISKETYDDAVAILKENNLYMSQYDYYMPCMWESMCSELLYKKNNIDLENGIDKTLIKEANKQNKKVYDVESAELQYGMLASLSDKIQEMLLQSAVESYKENKLDGLDELVNAWATGNKDGLRALLGEEPEFENEEEKQLYAEYNKALLTDRDLGMIKYVEDALVSGENVFVCVGAAHIVGENGIVDQLQSKGYTVEVVSE